MNKRGVRRAAAKKNKRLGRWIFAMILTLLNVILSILMRISDRKQTLQAIRESDKLTVLYTGEKTTKTE